MFKIPDNFCIYFLILYQNLEADISEEDVKDRYESFLILSYHALLHPIISNGTLRTNSFDFYINFLEMCYIQQTKITTTICTVLTPS